MLPNTTRIDDSPDTTRLMLSFVSPPLGDERQGIERQQEILADVFAGVRWEAPRALDAMRSACGFYFDLIAQVRVDRWTRGRVALLGDAGYSPAGVTALGTSLTLVGAHVLAGEIVRANGAYNVALARYQSVMRDYVKRCQELPPGGLEAILPRTREAMWIRNVSMRMMMHWPVRNLVAGCSTSPRCRGATLDSTATLVQDAQVF
jgi:2-polyprenyl-6-methoxyphenol hydroxylase-like FAD-dependent oxidoreductase